MARGDGDFAHQHWRKVGFAEGTHQCVWDEAGWHRGGSTTSLRKRSWGRREMYNKSGKTDKKVRKNL